MLDSRCAQLFKLQALVEQRAVNCTRVYTKRHATSEHTGTHKHTHTHAHPDCVLILQHPVPNAYTLALSGRKPFIVIHTALLELLDPNELQVNRTVKRQEV